MPRVYDHGHYSTPRHPGKQRHPKPPPASVFGGLHRADAPITRAQRAAGQRVDRATRKLPARPVPYVPVLRNPTRAQQRAASQILSRPRVQAGAGLTGAARQRAQAEFEHQVATDPRYKQFRDATRHYAARNRALNDALQATMASLDRVSPGRRVHVGVGPATITLDPAAIRTALGAVTSLDQGDIGPRQFTGRAGRDLLSLGTAPVVAGLSLGQGALDLAKYLPDARLPLVPDITTGRGSTKRLQQLAEGLAQGTYETFRHPIRSFEQHPVLTPLTFAGGASVLGRVAGAVARGTSRGRLASTVRPPLALTDDAIGPLLERTKSKDVIRAAFQDARDAHREPLRRADGSVVTRRQRGREVPVLQASRSEFSLRPLRIGSEQDRGLARQADFEASRANSVERLAREHVARELKVRGVKGRSAPDLVVWAVRGSIRTGKTFEADVRKIRDRLVTEYRARTGSDPGYRHSGEAEQAQANIKLLSRALTDDRVKAQAERIVAEGERIGRHFNLGDVAGSAAGLFERSPEALRRAALVDYAVEHMGAKWVPNEKGAPIPGQTSLAERGSLAGDKATDPMAGGDLRRADGTTLPTSEIEAHIRATGRDPSTVAYVPTQLHGRRAFHAQLRPGTRPVLDKPGRSRTGEAYRKGAVESSAEILRQHGVRQTVQLTKAKQLDRLVQHSGVKHPSGNRYFTMKEAEELADRIDWDTRIGAPVFMQRNGQRLVPMRAHAARLGREATNIIENELQGPGAMETLHLRLLNDRIVHPGETSGAENVVLVPAAKVDRLMQHLRPAGTIERFFQYLNRPFRMAVLPQPRWLAGNFAEPYVVRLTASGSGLNVFGLAVDMRAASKALRSMERSGDPKLAAAAQELRAHQFGGLFVGRRGASNRRGLEDFPRLERAYGELVSKLPAVQQATEVLGTAGRLALAPLDAFFRVNRVIESGAQRAAFGRQFRKDLQEFTGSWTATLRLQEKAVAEAAKGLVNTSTQERFMRAQHEMLGKYEGFNPTLRAWIQGPSPFLPWALNAARFVYWTMPAHHTALTAALEQVNRVVAKDWADRHKMVPPGSLRYALPNGKGGWIDVARYTPYGLSVPISEGEAGGVTGQVAPQFQGLVKALGGKDPFDRDLALDPRENAGQTKPNLGQRAGIAGYGLLEALIPYLATGRRLREGGGTAYAGSNIIDPDVKPGTKRMSALRRTFDPLRPTYLNARGPAEARPHGAVDPVDRALEQLHAEAADQAATDAAIDEALRRLAP